MDQIEGEQDHLCNPSK